MAIAHNLGFPRIGQQREYKRAVEAYWSGKINREQLFEEEHKILLNSWKIQQDAGIDYIPVENFSYDHVLAMSLILGVVPERFVSKQESIDINTLFCMARGKAPNGLDHPACEMTKWFDTNYHYIVPELSPFQEFNLTYTHLFDHIKLAKSHGYQVKPVLLGPISYLWLSKTQGTTFNKLSLLEKIIPVYEKIFAELKKLEVEWIQIDEPILALDLPEAWQHALQRCYQQFNFNGLKSLLATYFGSLNENWSLIAKLPVSGIHLDVTHDALWANTVADYPTDKVLSIGIISGRNIWRADLEKCISELKPLHEKRQNNLWIAPSCSLLHVPVDLDLETKLNPEIKSWLSFAKQKSAEIALITKALTHSNAAIAPELAANKTAIASRKTSQLIHKEEVKKRTAQISDAACHRQSAFHKRAIAQHRELNLPLFPTTTIGSFPQTAEIRQARHNFKTQQINETTYRDIMKKEIALVIQKQEEIGLDVFVHGEPERNDMVEYFGEHLGGFTISEYGWVQSYGSRCVKPPIIYGDVYRPKPMTIDWSTYAQSLTDQPVKGMLTGPVTILCWSFVRDDQPREKTAFQIAFALRDEVVDLEKAGIKAIQIDEPALREGLPLRKNQWQQYLNWATKSFRLSASGVQDKTQIHTHMCYSEFNDIIDAIANLDADVITIENARSNMELLQALQSFAYPNEIGPGVYDIHSPRIPEVSEIVHLVKTSVQYIPVEKFWINPDCGLKTRTWAEVTPALDNMVTAAKALRAEYGLNYITRKETEESLIADDAS